MASASVDVLRKKLRFRGGPCFDERGASASWPHSEPWRWPTAAWRRFTGRAGCLGRRLRRASGKSEARPGWSRDAFGGEVRDGSVLTIKDPRLLAALDRLGPSPAHAAIPSPPLRWVCKSTRVLAVGTEEEASSDQPRPRWLQLLSRSAYSLQRHPEDRGRVATILNRDAQFRHITRGKESAEGQDPVISVDTKKKELVGNYANAGRQWPPHGHGCPALNGHDFPGPEVPRAYPYGIYDVGAQTRVS